MRCGAAPLQTWSPDRMEDTSSSRGPNKGWEEGSRNKKHLAELDALLMLCGLEWETPVGRLPQKAAFGACPPCYLIGGIVAVPCSKLSNNLVHSKSVLVLVVEDPVPEKIWGADLLVGGLKEG